METLHFGSDALIWIGIAIIGYFLRDMHRVNKEQHIETRKAVEHLSLLVKSDDEILGIVNGKYVSRRENDLMLKESVSEHARLLDRIKRAEDEHAILREHWHDKAISVFNQIGLALAKAMDRK